MRWSEHDAPLFLSLQGAQVNASPASRPQRLNGDFLLKVHQTQTQKCEKSAQTRCAYSYDQPEEDDVSKGTPGTAAGVLRKGASKEKPVWVPQESSLIGTRLKTWKRAYAHNRPFRGRGFTFYIGQEENTRLYSWAERQAADAL